MKQTATAIFNAAQTAIALLAVSTAVPLMAAQPSGLLTRHTRDVVANGAASFQQNLNGSQVLHLSIVLAMRDQAGLDSFLEQVYDPQSPLYRQFLSVQEFANRFAPTQTDYSALVAFAQANGLTVTGTSPNRMVVEVKASVAAIEKALNVNMGVYQHPTENRTFYAPDREPSVNLSVPLWHIAGLDNFSIPHPASLSQGSVVKDNATGSGPGGQFIGSDFRAAYYGKNLLTGAGQSVGLFEYAGYNVADVTNYFAKVNQPLTVAVTGVSTDGSALNCSGRCDDTEQVLDIEVAVSMAPGMDSVLVYVSDTSDVSIFNRMASDNIAKSLSCSWGWSPADPSSDDPIFQEFAAQGQTLFTASGDSGAFRAHSRFVYPADDAYQTAVGGTDLVTNGAGGSWKSETAWIDSGGGISPNKIVIPSYQLKPGVITAANQGSLIYRNVPDVAAEGNEDNYICYDGTCAGGWGGTSFAAPRWAGFIALVNQQAVAVGHKTVGFFNPTLYGIGLSGAYDTVMHDITSGTNGTYSTKVGYDLVTGWGSPNGTALINLLAP